MLTLNANNHDGILMRLPLIKCFFGRKGANDIEKTSNDIYFTLHYSSIVYVDT